MSSKLILITGASSGIGAEMAKQFAQQGHTLLLLARNSQKLDKVCSEIKKNDGQTYSFTCDVGEYEQVQAVTNTIKKSHGTPDVIINNAGSGLWRFIEETSYEEILANIKAPYLAAAYMTKAFMPEMLARNTGHIVNMTSMAAKMPFSGATTYVASRKAMIGLHEALTMDLRGTGITASLSYFAKVESSFWDNNPGSEERLPLAQKLIPIISTETAAKTIVNGVAKGRRDITAPFMARIILFLNWLTPPITKMIMHATGYKR
ncbi:MAG: SDR family NAD(P)-dependent oxidoreductase [Methylophagaceae bacterium]